MRVVKTFEDCNVLFRELYNKLDVLNSQDINMQKRRVINASPSRLDYDYVVRKELLERTSGTTSEGNTIEVSSSGLYVIVFTNSGTIRTNDYASGPYIFKRRSIGVAACVSAVNPPGSDSSRFNLKRNGVDILNTSLVLPNTAASLEVVTSTDFVDGSVSFDEDDTLVLTVENGAGASKLTVELVVREL